MGHKKKGKALKRQLPVGYDGVMPTKPVSGAETKTIMERMARERTIQGAVKELKGEIQEIKDQKPLLPPPPAEHTYKQEIWKEDFDPMLIWVKVTCETCPYLVYAQYKDLAETVHGKSQYCAKPFGTYAEGLEVLHNWQRTVARVYRNMYGPEAATLELAEAFGVSTVDLEEEPASVQEIMAFDGEAVHRIPLSEEQVAAMEGESQVGLDEADEAVQSSDLNYRADEQADQDQESIHWVNNPGHGGPLDGDVIARGFRVDKSVG